MVTPTFVAAEDDAPLVECAVKIEVFTPPSSSRDLSQWATELEETALYVLWDKSNWDKSADLEACIRASNMVNFQDNSFKGKGLFLPNPSKYVV